MQKFGSSVRNSSEDMKTSCIMHCRRGTQRYCPTGTYGEQLFHFYFALSCVSSHMLWPGVYLSVRLS